jgi:hypothetical protein
MDKAGARKAQWQEMPLYGTISFSEECDSAIKSYPVPVVYFCRARSQHERTS